MIYCLVKTHLESRFIYSKIHDYVIYCSGNVFHPFNIFDTDHARGVWRTFVQDGFRRIHILNHSKVILITERTEAGLIDLGWLYLKELNEITKTNCRM